MPDKNTLDEHSEYKELVNPIPDPSPTFTSQGEHEKEMTVETPPEMVDEKANVPTPPKMMPQEERTWAMLAHLSVLLNLFSGFFGGIAALIIYLIYKERSQFVAYHAMQSFILQSIAWLGGSIIGGILIAIGGTLWFLVIPLLFILIGLMLLLLMPISIIYGLIGSVKVNNGEDFRYWQVGDWVRDILEPKSLS